MGRKRGKHKPTAEKREAEYKERRQKRRKKARRRKVKAIVVGIPAFLVGWGLITPLHFVPAWFPLPPDISVGEQSGPAERIPFYVENHSLFDLHDFTIGAVAECGLFNVGGGWVFMEDVYVEGIPARMGETVRIDREKVQFNAQLAGIDPRSAEIYFRYEFEWHFLGLTFRRTGKTEPFLWDAEMRIWSLGRRISEAPDDFCDQYRRKKPVKSTV